MKPDPSLHSLKLCPCCSKSEFRIVRESKRLGDSISVLHFSAASNAKLTHRLVVCKNCDLVFSNPIPHEKEMLTAYTDNKEEIHSSEYSNRVKSFSRVINWLKFKNLVSPIKKNYVVDVGCASGAFLLSAQNEGWEAVGYEPSKALSRIGREEFSLNIITGLFSDADFVNMKPDLITLWDVLEHISSPTKLLNQIQNSLRPQGLLVINIPLIDSFAAKSLKGFWPFYLDVHVLYFSRNTLINYLQRNGFRFLDSKPYWQTLSVGYLISRYINLPGFLHSFLNKVPFKYNMGQRTFVFLNAKDT